MKEIKYRVIRGGSWNYPRDFVRCAYRSGSLPNYRDLNLGFRVIKRKSDETK